MLAIFFANLVLMLQMQYGTVILIISCDLTHCHNACTDIASQIEMQALGFVT